MRKVTALDQEQKEKETVNEPVPLSPFKKKGKRARAWERVRRLFIAGILVIVPAFIAIYTVWLIMDGADKIFGPSLENLVREFVSEETNQDRILNKPYSDTVRTIISFLLAVIVILFVGWLSTFFFIRRMIAFGERLVSRIPLLKFLYHTPKEVITTFTASKKDSFKRVVMVEYPRRNCWALGFATGEVIRRPDNIHLIAIFVPTTPNPTSGFMLLVPAEELYDTNIPVEEGARIIISGGILTPDTLHTQRFSGLDASPDLPELGPLIADHHFDIFDETEIASGVISHDTIDRVAGKNNNEDPKDDD